VNVTMDKQEKKKHLSASESTSVNSKLMTRSCQCKSLTIFAMVGTGHQRTLPVAVQVLSWELTVWHKSSTDFAFVAVQGLTRSSLFSTASS